MHRALTEREKTLVPAAPDPIQADRLHEQHAAEASALRRTLRAPVLLTAAVCLLSPVIMPAVLTQARTANMLIVYSILATATAAVAAMCLLTATDTTVGIARPRLRWHLLLLVLAPLCGAGLLLVLTSI